MNSALGSFLAAAFSRYCRISKSWSSEKKISFGSISMKSEGEMVRMANMDWASRAWFRHLIISRCWSDFGVVSWGTRPSRYIIWRINMAPGSPALAFSRICVTEGSSWAEAGIAHRSAEEKTRA